MAKKDGPDWGRVPPERRTAWGRFLVWQRYLHDDQTQANVRDTLAKMGHGLSPAYYSDMETGKVDPIPDEWQAVFKRLWNGEPEAEPDAAPQTGDIAAVVRASADVTAAVAEQTRELQKVWAAISDLAAAIRESRLDPAELAATVVQTLEIRQAERELAMSNEPRESAAPRLGRG